jgi:YfiH family protein
MIKTAGDVSFLTFTGPFASVTHCFSLRYGGVSNHPYHSLNTGFHVGDDHGAVAENRQRLAGAAGYPAREVVAGEQVHGTRVAVVTVLEKGRGACSDGTALRQTDGLVCAEPGIPLMAHSADCLLLYFFNPRRGHIGLAHAGWRGAAAGMGGAMVGALGWLGSRPEELQVALSPAIGPCCYRVGEEFPEQVPGHLQERVLFKRDGNLYFDLPGLLRLLLLAAGLREESLLPSLYCTACNQDKFFSHRGSGGRTGRMAGVIMLSGREKR